MKLLDIFGGYTATTGSPLLHFAYFAACGAFYFNIVNKESLDPKWLDLIDEWFFTHSYFLIVFFLKDTIFQRFKEIQFFLFLLTILKYQSMILFTTIEHINHAISNNLHFFYAEDIAHFLIYSEIMTFCANLFTNVLIIFAASSIDIKIMKNNSKTEDNKKYLAQLEVIEKNDPEDAKEEDDKIENN